VSKDLQFLDSPVSCAMLSSCSAVDCCIDILFLDRSFHIVFDIDMCSRKMVISIEKLKIELSVLDYNWGKIHFLNMYVLYSFTCTFLIKYHYWINHCHA